MKNIWDKFSDIFGKTILHPQYFLKFYERQAIKEAKRFARGTLVDIGCGRQPFRNEFQNLVKKYIGVDHPVVSKFYRNKPRPDIFADATHIPLGNRSCQIALMISVLEHLPYPQKAIKEAYRLLSRKGHLVLITVQNYPVHDPPYDFFRYTRFGLEKIIKESGFKKVKIQSLGNIVELFGQYLNVFLLYKVKNLLNKKETKFLGFICLLSFYPFCLLSNIATLILRNLIPADKRGEFSLYNLAVCQKN